MVSDEDFDKKYLKSEYNEAALQIYRLHDLWVKCIRFGGSSVDTCNLESLRWTLDDIWDELIADAKAKDKEEYFKQNMIYNIIISVTKKKGDRLKYYKALKAKKHFLKCLQDDVGKGGKKKEDYEHM